MAEMPETQNITRVLFRDWRPQVVLNQHQTGPAGTVVFIPPFRDPFNFNFDPLVMTSLEEVGAAMQSRLLADGKRGGTSRDGAHYATRTDEHTSDLQSLMLRSYDVICVKQKILS